MPPTPKLIGLGGPSLNEYRPNRDLIFNTNKIAWVRFNVYWNTIQPNNAPTGHITQTWDAMRGHPELERLDAEIRAVNNERANGRNIGVILTIGNAYPTWTNGTSPSTVDPRNSARFAKDRVPLDCTTDSPYGWFVSNLTARYKPVWDPGTQWYTGIYNPGGPDWQGNWGGNSQAAWINLIEVANEPNTACWPQSTPDNTQYMACKVQEMMRTADAYATSYETFASAGPGMTDWPWPGSADPAVYTDIDRFTDQVTSILQGWIPGRPLYWSLHNYTDIKLQQTTRFDRIAARVDQRWWNPGDGIIITEGGYAIPLNQLQPNGTGEFDQSWLMSQGYSRFNQRPRAWTYAQWEVNDALWPPDSFQSGLRQQNPPPNQSTFRDRYSRTTWRNI